MPRCRFGVSRRDTDPSAGRTCSGGRRLPELRRRDTLPRVRPAPFGVRRRALSDSWIRVAALLDLFFHALGMVVYGGIWLYMVVFDRL